MFFRLLALILAGFCGWITPVMESKPCCDQVVVMSADEELFTADTLQWEPPNFSERQEERHTMVRQSIQGQGITDSRTLEAMRAVPRHLFVPEHYQEYAYQNRPLPINHGQTISQPYIVGYMTEMLELKPGEKVLEIGTGSGYQAAVLSELTPHVYTIEIVEESVNSALFEELGYDTITTKIGDGYKGWPQHAPFDAVILTAAPETIPDPLIDQLAPGGVLVAPVGKRNETQFLIKITKSEDGTIHTQRNIPVRFVPMTGEAENN